MARYINCPNCGAPLNRNGECEYCGTNLRRNSHDFEIGEINQDSPYVTMKIFGKEIKTYVAEIETEINRLDDMVGYGFHGESILLSPIAKRTFTLKLIEV